MTHKRVARTHGRSPAPRYSSGPSHFPMSRTSMNKIALIAGSGLLLAGVSAFAAGKPCEELKTEIAAKLDAKNVTGYSLEIVETDKAGEQKVVGTCEGGTKKIVYSKK
jgi:hypothetical protein